MTKKKVFDREVVKLKFGKKKLTIGTPHRIELVLLSLYFFFFFVANQAQNKFIDFGIEYRVITFWKTTVLALDVWIIFLILFHLALMGLFLMSLRSRATNRAFDVFAGILAFFGVALLLAGAIVQIYSETIRFLFMNFRSIDFYHLGVYIEIGVGMFWAFTK